MQPNKPDRPNRPNEQDRLEDFLSILLAPHKHDRGKQDGRYKKEREASDPGRPHNQGVIEPGLALRGELYNPSDTRPYDEIVGQGREKKDRHETQLSRQDHRSSRWIRDRNPPLIQQQKAREQEDGDRAPDHRPESTGDGPKSNALCDANGSRFSTYTSTTDKKIVPPIQLIAASRWSQTSRTAIAAANPLINPS